MDYLPKIPSSSVGVRQSYSNVVKQNLEVCSEKGELYALSTQNNIINTEFSNLYSQIKKGIHDKLQRDAKPLFQCM